MRVSGSDMPLVTTKSIHMRLQVLCHCNSHRLLGWLLAVIARRAPVVDTVMLKLVIPHLWTFELCARARNGWTQWQPMNEIASDASSIQSEGIFHRFVTGQDDLTTQAMSVVYPCSAAVSAVLRHRWQANGIDEISAGGTRIKRHQSDGLNCCLLYTSPSPRD